MRATPSGAGLAPGEVLGVLGATANVGHYKFGGLRCGQAKTPARFGAQNMLHGDGFAGTQQHPVKNGVRPIIGSAVTAGRHIETPGLNATVPVAPCKRHVFHARLSNTGADKVRLLVVAFPLTGGGHRINTAEVGNALRIGRGVAKLAPLAVRNPDRGMRHRSAFVQGRHPGQRVLTTQLEMDTQVGHQRRRTHIHGSRAAIALVEQGGAQFRRRNLNDMKAG